MSVAAITGLPAASQTTQEENRRRESLARYEHRRTQRAQEQFLAVAGHNHQLTRQYHPRYSSETEASFVSSTTLLAPKPAKKAFRKAQKAAAKPDLEGAVEHLEQAVELYPEYAAAWTLLGHIRLQTGETEKAATALERAVEIDPAYLEPYPELAYLAVVEDRWDDVTSIADQMLRVNPSFTLGYCYNGYALLQTGELASAEKALVDARATSDAALFPEVHYVLGEVYRKQAAFPLAAIEHHSFVDSVSGGEWAEQAAKWLREWDALCVIEPAR